MRPLLLEAGGGVCDLEPDDVNDKESKFSRSVCAYEAPTTMPGSLVLADALLGADERFRQNGEAFLSEPSRNKVAFGQPMMWREWQMRRNQGQEYEPTCVIS